MPSLSDSPTEPLRRPLGTMVIYGFRDGDVDVDLELAGRMGATHLEILPDWSRFPAPEPLRERVSDRGLILHSVHGSWGRRSVSASRVDLGDPDDSVRRQSVADVARCLDWLDAVGGRVLVVHPGGLSDSEELNARQGALSQSLTELAAKIQGSGMVIGVENMPPGVHPGSRMADLAALVHELDRPELALVLDTGHAHMAANVVSETLAAQQRIASTHLHDNDGRRDLHAPPGTGTLDWDAWVLALDRTGYRGPLMLECIRAIRQAPECLDEAFLERLARLTRR